MASLITHALLGAALGQAAKPARSKTRAFAGIGLLCSMLPDIDVIGFSFGIHYGDLWGHRGMTHSLFFAAIVAAIVTVMISDSMREGWKAGTLLFLITASHGVLDAMTNGGLGVAFFSPFHSTRYFFPWRPIMVSPIGAGRFFSERGLQVLGSEMVWLWGPILLLSGAIWMWRRNSSPAKSS
jgi:inner membrane protein